ncbi:hypothetical protein [Rhizobium laguerreae]|uniref:hypothetical protein n=1 Tax=Rhizobium laguerreae TaxID=1076926 RepID=UPI001C91A3B0|nr:hypothetical protein [Rhizobium laguerreae]MBY3444851.1 hypothetical protein [Rhizobium laguerreae]
MAAFVMAAFVMAAFAMAAFAIAGADAGKTLTRKQTNIQYFDFFRFYMNYEFLACILVI